ncbi:MAG: dihydrolipoyl dehydrogenase [Acidobacteria bacterium]|nr:dihydrolipoyl dehydrogenase [Acidobacteriota bacterium]
MDKFDLVVIGAGPGGYVAAIRAAQLKMKVALIEKEKALGGTCLNVGCIPSKVLLEATENYFKTKSIFAEMGISVSESKVDLLKLMERKSKVVKELTDGIAVLMKKNGVKVYSGTGKILGKGKVQIKSGEENTEIETENILIAVGSAPVELPFLPFDHKIVIDSTDALTIESIPEKMAVIGAGAIGLEMGSVYSRLGSSVTFVELLPRIAPFADSQSSTMLLRYLSSQGMSFKLESRVEKGEIKEGKAILTIIDPKGKEELLECEKVLVSVGRKPKNKNQGFEEIGIEFNEKGMIKVNEKYETSVDKIYAIGDCIEKGPMLAHKASEEGVFVVEKIAGINPHINYNAIPNVVYTSPELAQVGFTEEDAKSKGLKVKIGKSYYKANGRAKSLCEEDGFIKVVASEENNKLLGLHIVGPKASELIHLGVLCIESGGTYIDLSRMCHAHPTLSEAVKEAALNVEKRAIHG